MQNVSIPPTSNGSKNSFDFFINYGIQTYTYLGRAIIFLPSVLSQNMRELTENTRVLNVGCKVSVLLTGIFILNELGAFHYQIELPVKYEDLYPNINGQWIQNGILFSLALKFYLSFKSNLDKAYQAILSANTELGNQRQVLEPTGVIVNIAMPAFLLDPLRANRFDRIFGRSLGMPSAKSQKGKRIFPFVKVRAF